MCHVCKYFSKRVLSEWFTTLLECRSVCATSSETESIKLIRGSVNSTLRKVTVMGISVFYAPYIWVWGTGFWKIQTTNPLCRWEFKTVWMEEGEGGGHISHVLEDFGWFTIVSSNFFRVLYARWSTHSQLFVVFFEYTQAWLRKCPKRNKKTAETAKKC